MIKPALGIITDRDLGQRDVVRYGIYSGCKYFRVVVLDVRAFLNQDNHSPSSLPKCKCNELDFVTDITNIKTLQKKIQEKDITICLDLLGIGVKSLLIRRKLHALRLRRVQLILGHVPKSPQVSKFHYRLKAAFHKGYILKRVKNYLMTSFLMPMFEPKTDLSFYSGMKAFKKSQTSSIKAISGPSLDYQFFQNFNAKEHLALKVDDKYAVFLDQMGPSHPDFFHHKIKPPVTANEYYPAMNSFFDHFERLTGVRVVIASHPRGELSDAAEKWKKRLILKDCTVNLIKNSEFVIAHYSTAISFAVLYRKPIIQITTNEYLNSYRHEQFLSFASELKLHLLNIDEPFLDYLTSKNLYEFDQDSYEKYITNFLKAPDSIEGEIWEYVFKNEFAKH